MWILVLIVCGTSCQIETVFGTYTDKAVCEQAASEFSDKGKHLLSFRRDANCLPAPDDIVYE